MSIGSLGIIGSLSGSPLAQKGPEADKNSKEATDRSRQTEGELRAERAAGIGQTEEESQASERDADGRRPWELPPGEKQAGESAPAAAADSPATAKDPSGECGSLIDLQG